MALTKATTPPRYQMINMMKVKDGKAEDYIKTETKLVQPMHVEMMKSGGKSAWGLYSLVLPNGENQPFNYVTSDFYNKWKDIAAPADFPKAHDLDALLEYYADDAISLANDAPMMVGKAAIGEYYKNDVMGDGKIHAYQTIDVFAEGNIVVETGKSTNTDAAGKVSTGKYMALYEKRNGHYVCIREMYNNDQPSR